MSYESNEERIDRLENSVRELTALNKQMMIIANTEQACIADLVSLFNSLNTSQQSILRFIGGNPVFGDSTARQNILDIVSRAETAQDFFEARIANIKSRIKIDPPNPESK